MGRKKSGRPSKFKKEYCEMLIEHMRNGGSYQTFAAKIPDNAVNIDTLYYWEQKHPEFSDAKKRGFALCRLFFETVGNAIMAGKLKNGNNINWYMQMKNRFGWSDTANGSSDQRNIPIRFEFVLDKKKPEEKKEGKPNDNPAPSTSA